MTDKTYDADVFYDTSIYRVTSEKRSEELSIIWNEFEARLKDTMTVGEFEDLQRAYINKHFDIQVKYARLIDDMHESFQAAKAERDAKSTR